jgi:hypothetical protein
MKRQTAKKHESNRNKEMKKQARDVVESKSLQNIRASGAIDDSQ